MKSKLLANITPAEVLEEDFLKPMGVSQYRLAKDIGVPARRINEIVNGSRATVHPQVDGDFAGLSGTGLAKLESCNANC
jgi:hypothetical protein